jgi:hypothetical protein
MDALKYKNKSTFILDKPRVSIGMGEIKGENNKKKFVLK